MNDNLAKQENIIKGENYRITILTERLVRLEYNKNHNFEDRLTQIVSFRNFDKVNYEKEENNESLKIRTSYFTLEYQKEKPFTDNKKTMNNTLKISLNRTDRSWYYGMEDVRNYGGINYSLDDFTGKLKLSKGLYSSNGFSVIDDSNTLVMNNDNSFVERNNDGIDIYIIMYRKDLGLALKDYFTLTGYPQMIPRYALGIWWYKNKNYSETDIINLINNYKYENTPLSILMLNKDNYDQINKDKITNTELGLIIDPTKNNGIDNNINIYSIEYNNKADIKNLAKINTFYYNYNKSNTRKLIITRNHNLAIHKNGIINSGKTLVNWETLEMLPKYNSTASNNGISYIINPIGGYYKGIEDFELFIRYIQFGVFSPLFVLASDNSEYYRRETWKWNSREKRIINKYLELRNKLIPYIYTEAYLYHKIGKPIVQPLYYEYPEIYDEPEYLNQYYFGKQLLVCPITKKKNTIMNRTIQKIFLPKGTWYDFQSGKKYTGNKYYVLFYKEEEYPVFCKEGSIIPLSNDLTNTNPKNLEINIFPGKSNQYKLYEDDGITYNFEDNNYRITTINYQTNGKDNIIDIIKEDKSNIASKERNYKIVIRNTEATNVEVTVEDKSVEVSTLLKNSNTIIKINNINAHEIQIKYISNKNNINQIKIEDDLRDVLEGLEIETKLKEKIDEILFSDLTIRKKRIEIRKLKKQGLESKYIQMFLNLLEYMESV